MEDTNNQEFPISIGLPDLKNLTSWAFFKAIIDIVYGALSCLGFILILPAVYGVLQILAGVKLLNAVDDMKKYIETKDFQKISAAFVNLNRHFKFTGISIIIKIAGGILLVVLYGVIIAMAAPYLDEFLRNNG